jgi:molybdate transport system substrate-binding protein
MRGEGHLSKMPSGSNIKSFFNIVGRLALVGLVVWWGMGASRVASAGEVAVAAASDLNFAFKEVAARFEQETGHQVRLSLGSSGNFYAQIQHGAPFDVYFSADIAYPKKLEDAGFTVPGSLFGYAVGRIVLWTSRASRLDVSKGLDVLRDPAVQKIAIANPKHAPYGRAAVSAMKHYQVYESVKNKLVLGENISQAAQFIESGACDIGIVALSLALAPAMKAAGTYWDVPADAHPSLEQGAVILKAAKNRQAAEQLVRFIQGPQGQEIMTRYGFVRPN